MAEGSSDVVGDGAGKTRSGTGGDPRDISSYRVKSCKGCLYYSSLRKSKARNPLCVGISRTLKQVPGYVVGQVEMKPTKEGPKTPNLSDFKYSCVGYSVFLNKDKAGDKQENEAGLPVCAGLEILVDRRSSTAHHVPTHVHNKEDGTAVRSQPHVPKPAHSSGEDFYSRFKRSAGIVASGVTKNMNRVGNYVKQNLEDIMYPYRRRPK